MTDGVLLKEISGDFLLTNYSCLVIDEAHERSLNTDILIGLLSRVVKLRHRIAKNPDDPTFKDLIQGRQITPLKLVIMSATLRVEDFTVNRRLFAAPPPVLSVEGRQYPVAMHFSRKTPEMDFVGAAFKKVCKIHTRLPSGGILVFLSGQNEIHQLCRKLKQRFPFEKQKYLEEADKALASSSAQVYKTADDQAMGLDNDELPLDGLDEDRQDVHFSDGSDVDESEDDDDDAAAMNLNIQDDECRAPLLVLPLYALLPTQQQLRVFEAPPEGVRLCVVATNVAETSLTIPNIKYVVDSGKVKERQYDPSTAVASFDVSWTSKASADQRMGRAGRSGPGHCYRLFSSAVFENYFPQFSRPEIQRMPIEGVVLQMKSLNIDNVVNFPFPTAPDQIQLKAAERLLIHLGALDAESKRITETGKKMVRLPLAPRHARLLLAGIDAGCTAHAIALAAALTVGDPFMLNMDRNDEEEEKEKEGDKEGKSKTSLYGSVQKKFAEGTSSDMLKLINVIRYYELESDTDRFCEKHFLRAKAMKEIHLLRAQIMKTLPDLGVDQLSFAPTLPPLTDALVFKLKACILSGYIDQVAVRSDAKSKDHPRLPMYELLVAPLDNFAMNDEIFLHPSSCLSHQAAPHLAVFQDLVRTSQVYMKGLTAIKDPAMLATAGAHLCSFSKPLEKPAPRYDSDRDQIICYARPRFGDRSLELEPVPMEMPTGADRYRWLAQFILNGDVFPELRQWVEHLISKSSLMTNAKLPITHSKVMSLVQPLMEHKIKSKADLLRVWEKQPKFLLRGYLSWLPPTFHADVTAMWPPATR